jgi:hypothetical protein
MVWRWEMNAWLFAAGNGGTWQQITPPPKIEKGNRTASNEVIRNARSHITKNAATTIQWLVRESGVWWCQRKVKGLSIYEKKSSSNTTHAFDFITNRFHLYTRLPINFWEQYIQNVEFIDTWKVICAYDETMLNVATVRLKLFYGACKLNSVGS